MVIAILWPFWCWEPWVMQIQMSPFTLILADRANLLPGDVQQRHCSPHLYRNFSSKQSYQSATCTLLSFLEGTRSLAEHVNALIHLHRNELLQAVHTAGIVKHSIHECDGMSSRYIAVTHAKTYTCVVTLLNYFHLVTLLKSLSSHCSVFCSGPLQILGVSHEHFCRFYWIRRLRKRAT